MQGLRNVQGVYLITIVWPISSISEFTVIPVIIVGKFFVALMSVFLVENIVV